MLNIRVIPVTTKTIAVTEGLPISSTPSTTKSLLSNKNLLSNKTLLISTRIGNDNRISNSTRSRKKGPELSKDNRVSNGNNARKPPAGLGITKDIGLVRILSATDLRIPVTFLGSSRNTRVSGDKY